MRKWHIFALVIGVALLGYLLYDWCGWLQTRRIALTKVCWSLGKDLVTTTNSDRIVELYPYVRKQLEVLLASPTRVESVKLGDDPRNYLRWGAKATARITLVNDRNQHMEIGLREAGAITNFTVLGYSWY